MAITHLLNQSVTVKRVIRSDYRGGGKSREWATVGTIMARIRPAGAAERNVAQQMGVDMTHVMYCEPNADVQRNDRIEWTGHVAEVIAVRVPSKPHHLEVDLYERVSGN